VLARDLRVLRDILKQAYDIFDEICPRPVPDKPKSRKSVVDFDILQEGQIDQEGFANVLCRLTGADDASKLSDTLLWQAFRDADGDCSKSIGFFEFALWYSRHGFTENLLLSVGQKEVRDIARKYNLPLGEVEQYKRKFDGYDEDCSGEIEYDEFEKLIINLVKVPPGCELPPSRIKQFWIEADVDRSGAICFEEFLVFYWRYLRPGGNCPFEEYYRRIRKVNLPINRYE